MCGIAGVFNFHHERSVSRELLKKMADTISYRGPDGEGFFIDSFVGLAHRRLSIIDLGSGDQPMFNEKKTISIVFNGEIYNYIELKEELKKLGHSFVTSSDTEVIIKAYEQWGFACQEKLNGMWAFALWDAAKQHLFISRDRLGEKPLNYMLYKDSFLFGSEIKSILAYTGAVEPNTDMDELYLFFGYVPSPNTYYKSIKKLPAGNYLVVKNNKVTEHSYWDLPDIDELDLRKDKSKVNAELSELLYDSVRMRMRSDVPYGAFLSGGLDSSSIVAIMSEISSFPVKTFTIGFNEKAFDERDNARIIADKFKTEHYEKIVDKSSLEKSIKDILHHFDEPFADPAAIPTSYLAESAAKHVKMVLTGDGGDEVFTGYSNYQSELFAKRYQNSMPGFLKKSLPAMVDGIGNIATGNIRYKLNRIKRVLDSFNVTFGERLITKFVKIPPPEIKQLLTGNAFPIENFISDTLGNCRLKDPFYRLNYFHLKVSLPDQMLVKVDKTSMANSLETRAPLLDYRIVDLIYQVDKSLKMPTYTDKGVKYMLKNAMQNKLPNEILNRRKQGFEVPLREWFKDSEFDNVLTSTNSLKSLNQKMIKRLIEENQKGKVDHGTLLWRILLLQRWMSQAIA
ncbi:asparagine synthase (glutamine-hydrolyzing) [Maribacter arenosus]|uniref:asparagine synthase (glutamine-hydrolyzing) n=1 Tax=Maribacter arenosus TaxID=1854708 RepID=A0ABR7VG29_9FLAO|nr:asparagine synthase (glutamine-hydrolyzing) [Maribacter arenosus]MBD0852594.1 asparagine synthase (glutamine-hydrolyzing) [Maribacter arenosus]